MRGIKVYPVLKGAQNLSLGDTNFVLDLFHFLLVKRFVVHSEPRNYVVIRVAYLLKSAVHVFKL